MIFKEVSERIFIFVKSNDEKGTSYHIRNHYNGKDNQYWF
jgi:hypothetical protein